MKPSSSRNVPKGWKHVNKPYRFLFERGYEFVSLEGIDLGRQVVLRKQDLFLKIEEVRGEEEIYFRMGPPPPDEFTDIGTVIYAATGDKIPRWESSNPQVLDRYLDRIEAYFQGEYVRDKDSLRTADAEYAAAFAQGGVIAPPVPQAEPEGEPTAIPILHYPLLVVILLLIFGALMTLYMAMLDRLFAAFSLDADSYAVVMGVLALILAIGTMLLIRRLRRKG